MARVNEFESVRRVKSAEPLRSPRGSKYETIFSQVEKLRAGQTLVIAAGANVLASSNQHRRLRHRISMAVRRKFPGLNFEIFMTEDGVAVRFQG